jgi:hypothetical protein
MVPPHGRVRAAPPPITLPVVTAATDAITAMAGIRDGTPEQWAEVAAVVGLTVTVDIDRQDVALSYRSPFDAVLGGAMAGNVAR